MDAAVLYAKKGIADGVDALCDGIIALINGVNGIFSGIESLIPADYLDAYNTAKNAVVSKANTLKEKVVLFRDNTKASLYNLTGTITAIYQGAVDAVTSEANKAASSVKKEIEPTIKEIDQLLTEIGQEVNAASSAVGDEATRHYNIAKEKANLVKNKAGDIINNYKNKFADVVTPYIKPFIDKITPYTDKVAQVRDQVIAQGIEDLKEAKKTLDPYIKPFEDTVNALKDLASRIGGAVFQKFLQGVGAAGDALNSALGAAGKGLVQATDLMGDAAVAASGLAADASGAVYDGASAAAGAVASGASAAVNFVQETGSQAVNVAVNTAQQGYQIAVNAGSQVTETASNLYGSASSAASSAASQAYSTASNAYNNAQQQVSSTVSSVINSLPSISPSSFATGSPVSFSQLQSGAQAVTAKINDIVNAVSNAASAAYNAASSAASSVSSTISSGASTAAGGLSSAWSGAKSFVSDIFGSGGTPPPPPPPDYSAPTISNVAATSTTNSITVTWNTSVAAKTLMFYSATPNVNYNGQDAVTTVASVHDGSYYPETTNHSITVSNLNPGTVYYYLVYSYRTVNGSASDVAKQGIYSIVTQPTTAIIGGVVKDTQNNVLSAVNIFVDNGAQAATVTDATGKYAIEVTPGAHTITAKKSDFLSSSSTTSSLSAGQILPLDFTLADGKIYVSGSVKEAPSGTGIASALVKLLGPSTTVTTTTSSGTGAQSADGVGSGVHTTTQTVTPTIAQTNTDSSGAFSFVVPMNNTSPMQFTINASKADYTPYTSVSMSLARGAKMQNVEIRLPHIPPALSSEVSVTGITANHATIDFYTQANCSAFVQFGPQSSSNYLYQTATSSGKNSFYFDLNGLAMGTTFKYKVVLQDAYSNTVVAKENATFTTINANNFGNLSIKVLNGITAGTVTNASVVISAQNRTVNTNSSGIALFTDLPIGAQTITINNPSIAQLENSKSAQFTVVGNSAVSVMVYLSATSSADMGLNPTVSNITSNYAKLNINSTCKILKHKLVLRDTTTNTKIIDQDLGVLVSPVPLDLTSLIDGHNYTVELTSNLLANTTTGNAIKTETKNVTFSTVALPDFKIISFTVPTGTIARATTSTVNLACEIRINHTITNASLKILANTTEIFSQTFASFNPGNLNLTIPVAVSSIPGTDKIPLTLLFKVGALQGQVIEYINIVRPQQAAETQAQTKEPVKTKTKATAQ
ncbi:MAG: carboxypeptidase regulatory-like domain-containing protein [Candidatus Omnitrophica bacterium]|nr:carboxypeptidase regulatory-like domain-containing protein [Candidatus Omnitrophota bacterium]